MLAGKIDVQFRVTGSKGASSSRSQGAQLTLCTPEQRKEQQASRPSDEGSKVDSKSCDGESRATMERCWTSQARILDA